MRHLFFKTLTLTAFAASMSLAFAQADKPATAKAAAAKAAPAKAAAKAAPGPLAGQTVKIALIEGLSGAFGNVGQNQLKSYQFVAERLSGANNPSGAKFEFTAFDNKGSPQATLDQLKAAVINAGYGIADANASQKPEGKGCGSGCGCGCSCRVFNKDKRDLSESNRAGRTV